MAKCLPSPDSLKRDYNNSYSWEKLYRLLWLLVKGWVYSAHISSWLGQEEDIVAEIVQEAVCRTFERLLKAEKQESEPVNSPEYLSKTIARNYFIDLIRKDSRIMHLSQISRLVGEDVVDFELADVSEEVHDDVFHESLFNRLAPEIVNFPKKQCQALLIDIANHMHFDTSYMTPLQRAFLKSGIRLQDYQRPRLKDAIERSRYSAILRLAYKRICHLNCMQPYISTM